MLEVVEGGPLTTVQDAGRPGHADLGVPVGGACDEWSLAAANLLQGNAPGAPALEVTLGGLVLVARTTCTVALAGADLAALVPEEGRTLAPLRVHLLRAGMHLRFAERRSGARAYLALRGGIAVPRVLESASTCLPGGFGGLDGRPLLPGDRLIAVGPERLDQAGRRWPGAIDPPAPQPPPVALHVVDGPHASRFAPAALDALLGQVWEVGPASDRTGIRLVGDALEGLAPQGELVSAGTVWGAMQVPPDGSPIVLLADAPTVGGYRVPAVVIRADLPALGQLAPGDRVRFSRITIEQAQERYRSQRRALERAAALLSEADRWDELTDRAGT